MDFRIKTITYLALFFIISSITAQNNLVFNKVLTFKLIAGQTAEVPEGKTWKIESTSIGTGGTSTPRVFYLNKDIVDYGEPLTQPQEKWVVDYGSSTNIWLQEGTILSGTGNVTAGDKFSILEFNIEPISSGSDTNTVSGGVNSNGLQFNSVINKVFTSSNFINPLPNSTSDFRIAGAIEVPTGKVWKINDVQTYNERSDVGGNPGSEYANCNILVGDYFFTFPSETRKDIYLTSGTHIVKFNVAAQANSSFRVINKVTINAIEYNE